MPAQKSIIHVATYVENEEWLFMLLTMVNLMAGTVGGL